MSEHKCYWSYAVANNAGGYDAYCEMCGRLMYRTTTQAPPQRHRYTEEGIIIEDVPIRPIMVNA